ncbi:MAG: zinc-dependent peptidase [Proteobacteria bacterium]|nr:zinc-dependent peptidase [Pseudomonadota bacterium]
MFGMFKGWRRRRILANRSIPDAIWQQTMADIPAMSVLDAKALERLRALTLLFLHEKNLEPAGGLELDDAMRTRIAALACRPILGLGLDYYESFLSVIVYPEEFLVRNRESVDEAGVVHTRDEILSGEAWEQGPVILAWQDVDASGRAQGFDVVAHECAHKLDLLDGDMNGRPPLNRGMRADEWAESFQTAYDDLIRRLDRGEEPWLDPYAAEEPAEFFAVCTEMFFDVPCAFRVEYPSLYAQLAAFFRQDPARGNASPSC